MSNTDTEFEYIQGEGWRPKPNDIVEGEILDIAQGYSVEQDENYPILTIADKIQDKPIAVHCFHSVLKTWVLTNQPQLGSTIGIKFLGKKKKKNNPKQEVSEYVCRLGGNAVAANPYAGMVPTARDVKAAAPDEDEDEVPY
ncbi:MAG TPA: hypothetical protein VGF75_01990 [Candidatus Saccharimonadales bacterium]|jgi:hypothetical protein